MIVSCPTCATHYTHPEQPPGRTGRCSRCDDTFPLNGPKRRYRLTPAIASRTGDPLLATGLSETETLVDRPDPGLMHRPETPAAAKPGSPLEPASPLPADPAVDPILDEPADEATFFSDSLGDDEALFGIDDPTAATAAEATADAEPEPRPGKPETHPVRETVAVFLLAGLGAAAGYQGSIEFGFELLNAIGIGLGVGITFGWAWIRWAERKR